MWNIDTEECVASVLETSSRGAGPVQIEFLKFDNSKLIVSFQDGSVKLWILETGTMKSVLPSPDHWSPLGSG